MEIDWINLLQVLGGVLLGGGGAIGWKAAKRKGMVEATESKWAAEDKRLRTLLDAEVRLTERMSEMNATIDKHIDRNRELSDRLYMSETELNRVNAQLLAVTEERDAERAEKEHFRLWHCRHSECTGRQPPNERLKGRTYEEPLDLRRLISMRRKTE